MTQDSRIRFTKRTLEAIKPPAEGREYVYDADAEGLAICITAAGRKTFYRTGRIDGRYVRLRLGTFPTLSVEQARKLALQAAAKISEGADPQAEKLARRNELTVETLWTRYLEDHAKLHKKTWREDEAQYRRYLTPWASKRISGVTQNDVAALHATIGSANGRYAANRVVALLRKMFGVATRYGYEGANPCVGIKMFREESRDRFLTADEIKRFQEALEHESNVVIADYFRILLLTGARRSNVLAMRWEDVDLVRQEWRIPTTKSGDPVRVYLPPQAIAILQRRLESRRDGEEWTFPSYGRTGHLAEPKIAWGRITKRAGLEGVRMHDLRRTVGSWAAITGASLPVIGKALGHRSQASTSVYARLSNDPVRAALDKAFAAMMPQEGADDGE